MKRAIKDVFVSSLIALVLYFALFLIWTLLSAFITNAALRSVVVSIVTAISFCLCLLYISKIRPQNDREVFEDYSESAYSGILNDVKFVWKREAKYIYVILAICAVCFILTAVNGLLFERSVISFPTLIFFPITVMSALFKVKMIGYLVSAVFVSATYFLTVLIYRRRQYTNWE